MLNFVVRRIFLGMIVLLLVTIIVFLLLQLIPGDPAYFILGINATPEQISDLRNQLWLDRPVVLQYVHWFQGAVHGDFGDSITFHRPVSDLISARLPITMQLSFVSLIISTVLGILAGIVCAVRRGGRLDSFITLIATTGIAIPIFWLGILGIYLFGLKLGWVPIQGYTSPFDDLWMSTKQTIMPIFCLAVPPIAFMCRQTRSSMLEVVRQDYIRTAWAKGLKERTIVLRHALKNSLIPVITFLGIGLGTVIGGSVMIETVFNIPGMGRLIVQAALAKDVQVVQACVLLISLIVIIANLLVDISYGWLDPRIHYD